LVSFVEVYIVSSAASFGCLDNNSFWIDGITKISARNLLALPCENSGFQYPDFSTGVAQVKEIRTPTLSIRTGSIEMSQLQISKPDLQSLRITDDLNDQAKLSDGEILVKIDRFGFSANNVTYGVAGDTLGYWQFFPPQEEPADWGVLPVWGFGDVIDSRHGSIEKGERLFGYFPPANHLVMKPVDIGEQHFFEGAAHRAQLPKGYNLYRRVSHEHGYDKGSDDTRMLLYPLYITSFALWDQLKESNWYGAEQIVLISASSKTSIGLAYALNADDTAPDCIGLTSARNLDFVKATNIYSVVIGYEAAHTLDDRPTVIVDMSGNAELLGALHQQLGTNMLHTLSVGLTHWESERRSKEVIKDRTEFFFAPARIQKRMKDWGAAEFNKRSAGFVGETASKSASWLKLETLDGLEGLQSVFADVRDGKIDPQRGLIIQM